MVHDNYIMNLIKTNSLILKSNFKIYFENHNNGSPKQYFTHYILAIRNE
jgi:hypothetical protein